MPEIELIPTQTTLSVIGTSITITTRYIRDNWGGVLRAWISEVIGGEIVDGVSFIEGQGGITHQVGPIFSLSPSGELIVTTSDASNFSVNTDTGQLVYTY